MEALPAPACAACKHRRRKCAPGCPLAPYFPADKPDTFRKSHRLFGIKKILELMTNAGPELQDDCMKSVQYEADARAADPVRGSHGVVQDLYQEWSLAQAELGTLREQVAEKRREAQARAGAPGFLSAAQPWPWVPPQPFYGGYVPPGAVKIDGDARVGVKIDEKRREARDAPPGFLSPVQPWMLLQQPLLHTIPEERQKPFYGGHAPPGALQIDGDARVGLKLVEDDAMSDEDDGRTLVGAPSGRDVPSSSSYESSDPLPRGL